MSPKETGLAAGSLQARSDDQLSGSISSEITADAAATQAEAANGAEKPKASPIIADLDRPAAEAPVGVRLFKTILRGRCGFLCLEHEPAAATKTSAANLRRQLAENGATDAETTILLTERVELNAMTSDALVAMIERKLKDYGLQKVIPDDDLLAEAYLAFHRSNELQEQFEELEDEFEESKIKVPKTLKNQVRTILTKHPELRWDDALKIVLDETQLPALRAEKQKAKKKSGDFTDADEEDGGAP
jgi:hypothetical protein